LIVAVAQFLIGDMTHTRRRTRPEILDADRARGAFADMNVFWNGTSQRINMATISEVDLRWKNQIVLRYHQAERTITGEAAV
jgi:hypothetical protein